MWDTGRLAVSLLARADDIENTEPLEVSIVAERELIVQSTSS